MTSPVPPAPAYAPPSGIGEIIHSDEAIIVANKPAGLLSVPGRGEALQDCLQRRLENAFGPLEAVHRLDMDTSGLIVFARSKPVAKTLGEAFRERTVEKTYVALVHGEPEACEGEIDLPIGRDWEMRPKRCIDEAEGQPSHTEWTLVSQRVGRSLLALTPLTGRTHQLRVHLSAIGHPILGDRLYGRNDGASRLHLHACKLAFEHPQTGARMAFSATHEFTLTVDDSK